MLCLEHTRARDEPSNLVRLLVVFAAIYDALGLVYDDRSALWTRSPTLAYVTLTSAGVVSATALLTAWRSGRDTERPSTSERLKAKLLESPAPPSSASAFDRASFVSHITYSWLAPLLALSHSRRVELQDVPDLPAQDATATAARAFRLALAQELATASSPSFLRVTRRLYGRQVLVFAAWSLLNKAIGLTSPLLIKLFLDWAGSRTPALATGYALAAAMVTQAVLSSVSSTQYSLAWQRFDLRVRAGIVSAIYDQSLALSAAARRRYGLGRITNLVSVDLGRLVGMPGTVFDMVLIPGEIAVALMLLSREVSYAFVAGVAVLGVMLPIQTVLGGKIQSVTQAMLAHRDARVSLTAESLKAIRTLKLLAWVDTVLTKMDTVRQREVGRLAVRKYLDALCVFFWASTPVIVQTSVFAVVIYSGRDITAANAFTAVALLDRLIFPMNYFPWIINGFLEARVSALRIRAFLFTTDVFTPLPLLPLAPHEPATAAPAVTIHDCIFTWDAGCQDVDVDTVENVGNVGNVESVENENSDNVEDIATLLLLPPASPSSRTSRATAFELSIEDLTLAQGRDYVVCGPVGAGKSSLLLAVLGEMRRQSGAFRVRRRRAAFAPQTPWLFQGSIRYNITMCPDDSRSSSDAVDEARYRLVLEVCELETDLRRKPQLDRTPVGENGSNLSGGQRLRVSLARALYQRTSLYLLDDPLSGLDAKTAARIVTNCFGSDAARRALFPDDATVVLVTHSIQLLERFASRPDMIVMESGSVLEHGAFSALTAPDASSKFRSMLQDASTREHEAQEDAEASTVESEVAGEAPSTTAASPNHDSDSAAEQTADKVDNDDASEEHRASGVVNLRVWRSYASAIGAPLALAIVVVVALMQVSRNGLDWWIGVYTTTHSVSPTAFARTLILIACVNCAAVFLRSFLFAFGGLRAARRVYRQLVASVFGTSLRFFDATPVGRILNRLSGDTYAVDESLPFILNIFLKDAADVAGALVILFYGNKLVLVLLVPLSLGYVRLQRAYRPAARDIRRLDAVAQSPILSLFTETLDGLTVIRALQLQTAYARLYETYLSVSQRMAFVSATTSAWFGIRLDMLGVCVTSFVAVSAVIEYHVTQTVRAGILGLTLTYALPIVSKLNAVLGSFVATEQQMIAVERVREYMDLPDEDAVVSRRRWQAPQATDATSSVWPRLGAIDVTKLSVVYAPLAGGASVTALAGVTCSIAPGEKVGVCGRTGAGKSTFLNAIFRAVAWQTGGIAIDNVDLATLSLRELRSKLTYVPQDVVLFAGSIRSNLDPTGRADDHALWSALAKCGLDTAVRALAHGLDSVVEAGDATLSKGQSQLVGVARALLRPSKVLCIDEATASIDFETEERVTTVRDVT